IRLLDQIAVEIDLDQVRGRHLIEQQPEAVEQEMAGLTGHARRDVGVDQVGPAEVLDQPVARREIDPLLPLGGTEVRAGGPADCGESTRWLCASLDVLNLGCGGDTPAPRVWGWAPRREPFRVPRPWSWNAATGWDGDRSAFHAP